MSKEGGNQLLEKELDIQHTESGCAWESIFAAASAVQLEELDNDFLEKTESHQEECLGFSKLARLAMRDEGRALKNNFNGKFEEEHDDVSTSPNVLEGKMVLHPSKRESIMVLVDGTTKNVYSAFDRSDDGNMIKIGKFHKDGYLEWIKGAFTDDGKEKDCENESNEKFPFPTDPDDHCESPIESYKDIVSLLEQISPKDQCQIYDPYYCDGAVKRNLQTLGFPRVHNVKEDCYQVWSNSDAIPNFHVLVSNPPYSDDHIPKLVEFLSSPKMKSKPWFLLMPQWVSKKPYFVDTWDKKAFYLVPKRRYIYYPPKKFRVKKASDVHKKSSPFITIWFVWGGSIEKTNQLYDFYRRSQMKERTLTCNLARSKNALRDLRRKRKRKSCD
mmetsp:Transcript_35504/g.39272  ORF Transcript_35504/g.39272 Transcript_35504/m.39272 type:complete len:386 (+) Transcript_35504:21-1178(+)